VPSRNFTVRSAVVAALLEDPSIAVAAVNEPNAAQSLLNSRRFKTLMVFSSQYNLFHNNTERNLQGQFRKYR